MVRKHVPLRRRPELRTSASRAQKKDGAGSADFTKATTQRADERDTRLEPRLDGHALYRLMAWLSPAYPVGAFSYSSGIEWAVEAGDVTDAVTLRDWLALLLTDGG